MRSIIFHGLLRCHYCPFIVIYILLLATAQIRKLEVLKWHWLYAFAYAKWYIKTLKIKYKIIIKVIQMMKYVNVCDMCGTFTLKLKFNLHLKEAEQNVSMCNLKHFLCIKSLSRCLKIKVVAHLFGIIW